MRALPTTIVAILFLVSPWLAFAATPTPAKLVYAGWIPYWAKASGTPDAIAHITSFHELSPFAYEMDDDGTIQDAMKLAALPWTDLMASATLKKVKIIPTILSLHGEAMHALLSATSSRKTHEDDIVATVVRNNFAGIDIDYENKLLASKYYFSAFIKELSVKLNAKSKSR